MDAQLHSSASYQLRLKFSSMTTCANWGTGRGFVTETGPLGGRFRSVDPTWWKPDE
jgi:hypothetical protein